MDANQPDDLDPELLKVPSWHDPLAEVKRREQQIVRAEKVAALSSALTFAPVIEKFLRKVGEIAGMFMFSEGRHAREPGSATQQLIELAFKNAIGNAFSTVNPSTIEAYLGSAEALASELAVLAKNPAATDFEQRVQARIEHWAMTVEIPPASSFRRKPIL